ncbi:hypothetical protein Drorol1_Dr00000574 [Drosera rotundifolia]
MYRASPPLSAIERFLHGQKITSSQNQSPKRAKTKVDYLVHDHFGVAMNVFDGGIVSWASLHALMRDRSMSPSEGVDVHGNKVVTDLSTKNDKGVGLKRKADSSTTMLIKGPWSEEEDRELIELVEQYGLRKWAKVASKLVGRAEKQCRERWHNHLRPDIKMDSWSEEDERMLIQAHEQCGNKWAEIAKRIPGRTENSIKNHWNATKRRQNAMRKKKKASDKSQSGKSQNSILLDYIMSITLPNQGPATSDTTMIIKDLSAGSYSITTTSSYNCSDQEPVSHYQGTNNIIQNWAEPNWAGPSWATVLRGRISRFCFHHHRHSILNSATSLVAIAYELVVSPSIFGKDGGGRQESFKEARQQGRGKEEVVQGSRNLR